MSTVRDRIGSLQVALGIDIDNAGTIRTRTARRDYRLRTGRITITASRGLLAVQSYLLTVTALVTS